MRLGREVCGEVEVDGGKEFRSGGILACRTSCDSSDRRTTKRISR
jgi:hypothetical protein